MNRKRSALALALAVLLALAAAALPAAAQVRPNAAYTIEVDVSAAPRMVSGATLLELAVPRKARVRIGGRRRTVPVRPGATVSGAEYTRRELLRLLRRRWTGIGNSGVFVDRPITHRQKRMFGSRLLWIDGDALIANHANPLCREGMSLAGVRRLLTHAARGRALYATGSAYGDALPLFGIKGRVRDGEFSWYGRGVQFGRESSVIRAVVNDQSALAAVTWSGSRRALAAGRVCAVPIGHVTPSVASLRAGSYPATVDATFVYNRRWWYGGVGYARRWYLSYLHSRRARHLLKTGLGRQRLLP